MTEGHREGRGGQAEAQEKEGEGGWEREGGGGREGESVRGEERE